MRITSINESADLHVEERPKRKRRYIWALLIAAALIGILSGIMQVDAANRPFRHYTEDGNTSFTQVWPTNMSNITYNSINGDNPTCEWQVGDNNSASWTCMNKTSFYTCSGNTCTGVGSDGNNYTIACSSWVSGSNNVFSCSRNGASNITWTVPDNAGTGGGNLTASNGTTGWWARFSNQTNLVADGVVCDYASGYALGALTNSSVCFLTFTQTAADLLYYSITNPSNYISTAPNVNVTNFNISGSTITLTLSNGTNFNVTFSSGSGNTSSNLNTNAIPVWNGTELINSSISDNATEIYTGIPFRVFNGTVSSPSYSFRDDTNNGMFLGATDTVGITAGGVTAAFFTSTYIRGASNEYFAIRETARSATSPTYSWRGDEDTGIGSNGANNISFTTQGIERGRITQDGNWSIGNTAPNSTLDITGNTQITGDAFVQDSYGSWTSRAQLNVIESAGNAGIANIRTNSSYSTWIPPGSTPTASYFTIGSTRIFSMVASTLSGTSYSSGDYFLGTNVAVPVFFSDSDRASICINCNDTTVSGTNANFSVVGTSNFTHNVYAISVRVNSSEVCTATNGLCNVTFPISMNGTNGTTHNISIRLSDGSVIYTVIDDTTGAGGASMVSMNVTNVSSTVFNVSIVWSNGTTYYAMGSLPLSGSGSPGGSVGEIQYNNGGFAGSPNMTFNNITNAVTFGGDVALTGLGDRSLIFNTTTGAAMYYIAATNRMRWDAGGASGLAEFLGGGIYFPSGNPYFDLYSDSDAQTFLVKNDGSKGANIQVDNNATFGESLIVGQNATVSDHLTVANYVLPNGQPDYWLTLSTEFCANVLNNGNYNDYQGVLISSGSMNVGTGNASHPCVGNVADSTTAFGGISVHTRDSSHLINGTENGTLIWNPTSGQDFYIQQRFGFFDTSTQMITEPVDGCWFNIQQNNHSGQNNQLSGRCASNSVNENTTNNYTFTNNTWYILNIYINPTATNVTFSVYNETGTLLWNNSLGATRIPIAVGRETGFGYAAAQNNTDAAVTFARLDYMDLKIKRRLNRGFW